MIVDLNMDLYIQRANVVKFLNDRHDWDKLKSMLSFQLKQVWGGMLACILMYFLLVLRGMLACKFFIFLSQVMQLLIEIILFI